MNSLLSYQQLLLFFSFQAFLYHNGQNYQASESHSMHLCPSVLLTIIIKGETLGKIYSLRPDLQMV